MPDTRSIKELFRSWRQGDRDAGQTMAQRFADWYYAIATSRLGEDRSREPLKVASEKFMGGVSGITESRALVGWAHRIIQDEVGQLGGRVTDGDEPSQYTGNKRPKGLLASARTALPDEVALLEACYGTMPDGELEVMAKPFGGMPLGALRARYKVKRWLIDNASMPFDVAPAEPNLDRAPLPLYESGRMETEEEQADFEHWMLTDIDLCRDIAEFAHFAIALRGGLADATPAVQPSAPGQGPARPTVADAQGGVPDKRGGGGMRIVVIGVIGIVVVLVLLAALVGGYFLLF